MSHSALPPVEPLTTVTPTADAPAPSPVAVIETEAKQLMSPAGRLWLYGVCVAALPLLVAFGKVSGDQVSLWTDFAASILGVSGLTVAIANVKK